MTQSLKTSLTELADTEYADAPASTVDIGRARADGRRRMIAARMAPIGGGVAVVAACALVVSGLGGAASHQSTSPAPSTKARKQDNLVGTDPVVRPGAFGWLPSGYTSDGSIGRSDGAPTIQARAAGNAEDRNDFGGLISVEFFTSMPPLAGHATKEPATVPGAKTAYYEVIPGTVASPTAPSEAMLVWQGPNGSWARLVTSYTETRADLVKMASGVTFDDTVVPLPIHIEGWPRNLPVDSASWYPEGLLHRGPWTLHIDSKMSADGQGSFHVVAQPASAPPMTYPGLPGSATPGHWRCKAENALQICVQSDFAEGAEDPLASVGGAKGLLDRITSLGTDRSNWTTHVVN